jgi:hypothetical protein
MLPGQYLLQGSLTVGVKGGVKHVFLERFQPVAVVKTFLPGIEPIA